MKTSPSDALVLFGVTGDLAHKMIFPALYAMAKREALKVPIIGVAAPDWTIARLHDRVKDSLTRAGGIDNKRAFRHLLSLLKYVSGDYNDAGTFTKLKAALAKSKRPAHYLAICWLSKRGECGEEFRCRDILCTATVHRFVAME